MSNAQPAPIPARAVALSVGALLVPLVATLALPGWVAVQHAFLVWLTPLIPAFMLTYYRGLKGSAVALALGMAILSVTHAVQAILGLSPPDWSFLFATVILYLALCLGIAWITDRLRRERNAAEQMALTDALTGLPNRRHVASLLDTAFGQAQRGYPVSVVLFDIDHFKQFNDRHGHAAGDEVLRAVGWVLASTTRRMDLSSRYGGEEFLTVLLNCGVGGATAFVERVRGLLERQDLDWGPVTVSAGVAAYSSEMESPDELVAAADRALYAAKEAGRNCTRVAQDIPARWRAPTPEPRFGREEVRLFGGPEG